MKLLWATACLDLSVKGAVQAVTGTGSFGGDWFGRGYDGLAAVMFFIAMILAIRSRAPWLTFA